MMSGDRSEPAHGELMSEFHDEPPRVDLDVPMARRAPREPPQPGFWLATILTFAYWIVLIGFMVGFIVVAAFLIGFFGPKGALETKPGADAGKIGSLSPALRDAVAWSFPAGYFGGLLFSVVILRALVGRSWIRDIGLARLPLVHLLLAVLAMPGFVIVSSALAQLLQPIDPAIFGLLGFGEVGDQGEMLRLLFQDFHWSFAVFAIGVGPGVVEELWCRGFLGRGLVGRNGWFVGIALSSLFFGALHVWPPSYVLVTAAMGAGLHFAYVASRSLWVPIAIHLANNSFAALGSVQAISTEGMEAAAQANPVPIVALASCLLICCGLAMWQARWTWPGEQPGLLIPPARSGLKLTRSRPSLLLTLAAFGFCAALMGLLLA